MLKKMRKFTSTELKQFLDEKSDLYNQPGFIENDPISIPHAFRKKQDIEIAGLFASVLAWGQRKTIIRKCRELLAMMDNDPHQFILTHRAKDLTVFEKFKHRTFNATDTLYFIAFLKWYYQNHSSLEEAFKISVGDKNVGGALVNFHQLFFSLNDHPRQDAEAHRNTREKIYLQAAEHVLAVDGEKRPERGGLWNLEWHITVSTYLPLRSSC